MTDKLYIITSAQLEEWFPKSHEIFESQEYGFCAECKHWRKDYDFESRESCQLFEVRDMIESDGGADFEPPANFGCNRFEPKP